VTDPDAVLTLCARRNELPLAADAYLDAGREVEAALLLQLWAGDREPKRLADMVVGVEVGERHYWFPTPFRSSNVNRCSRHYLPLDIINRMPRKRTEAMGRYYPTYGAAWLAYLRAEAGTRQEVEV
jgi:hypothetical protein